jgi:hypothetical protein
MRIYNWQKNEQINKAVEVIVDAVRRLNRDLTFKEFSAILSQRDKKI